jgi:hypothetical protein
MLLVTVIPTLESFHLDYYFHHGLCGYPFRPRSPVYIQNLARTTRYSVFAAASYIRRLWHLIDWHMKEATLACTCRWCSAMGGMRVASLQNYRLGILCCGYRLLCPTMKHIELIKNAVATCVNADATFARSRASGRVGDVRRGCNSCFLHQCDADPCAGLQAEISLTSIERLSRSACTIEQR